MSERAPTDKNHTPTREAEPRVRRSRWRLPLLLAIVLVAMVVMQTSGLRQIISSNHADPNAATSEPSAGATTGQTVQLVIQFADGNERHDFIPWHDGMTVENLLASASRLPKGIHFAQQGSGESALLTEINGAANEGGSGRNWTYSVNGQEADRSFAIYQLHPGDHVLWTFASRQ
jgi:Domain of unknown function (DUF4430)